MHITCPKCSHEQEFSVEVKSYKGYVCPSCNAYFKTNENASDLVFVRYLKTFSSDVVTTLNEVVKDGKNNYSVITLIEREDVYGYSHYEYIGLDHNDKDIYFGHGVDYYCRLNAIEPEDITTTSNDRIQFAKFNFNLEYDESYTVRSAAGFVFEDLNRQTRNKTYIHNHNENKFISEEHIDGEKEYYSGAYLQFNYFKNYFKKLKDRTLIEEDSKLIFIKIFGLAIVAIISIFLLFNINNLRKQKRSFYETFTSEITTNQFVGNSFSLTGNTKMLAFEGISETNNPSLNLWVKLVNEKTNEVIESKLLPHYHNDINFASGITVDFCKVEAGNYHFVFETSSNINQPLDYKMDYRITHGNLDYYPLLIAVVILVVMGIILFDYLFGENADKFYLYLTSINYQTVLKQNHLGKILVAVVICFTAYLFYQNYMKECATATSSTVLEDHTYTGSRSHYYRSYYSDGSGHK